MKYLILILVVFLMSFSTYNSDWKVPENISKIENPIEETPENLIIAKNLWTKHCKSCHGKIGLGDGTKSEELDSEVPNFSDVSFQSQTDGDLYYKTKEGREDMPGFGKKITEEDIWLLVNHMRTQKKSIKN